MVNLNLREDIFPEYPVLEGMHMKKRIRNVFELWKDEPQHQIDAGWEYDIERSKCFSISYLVREYADQ